MEGAPAVRVLGRYALHGVIASGGMATVHYGRLLGAAGFARTVAIKRLHPQYALEPEFVAMFVDEARLASRVRSPHVVTTLDVVTTSGELFLVMEYVAGESLARLIRSANDGGQPVPVAVAVAVMAGALRGLHAAHEAHDERGEPLGIVHRDVSPQNVIVGSDGLSRVLDFGVAKASGRLQTTREGQLKGKLGYMGPEQLRGDGATRATDVYAASVVLWELLVGERLFRGDNEGAIVTRVMQGNVTRPSRASAAGPLPRSDDERRALERLDPVVMRGIDRDRSRRFATAREMAVALEEHVPPASGAQVTDWLEKLAGPVLAERARQIAAIEAGAGSEPAPDPASAAEPTLAEAAPELAPGQATQASSISVTTNTARERGARRIGLAWRVAGGGLVAALLAAPVVVYLRMRPPPVVAAPVAADAIGASPVAVSSDPVEGSGAPALSSPEAPLASSSAPALPAAPAAVPTRRPSRPARPNDCNPPFTWDAQGKKHYKASCL